LLENLLILIILGCFGYFAWFVWYVHKSQINLTLYEAISWMEERRYQFLEEVGGERIGSKAD